MFESIGTNIFVNNRHPEISRPIRKTFMEFLWLVLYNKFII